MKKIILFFVFSFFFLFTNAQKRGINVIKDKDTLFLIENKRIKLETQNGEVLVGKFTLIDNTSIKVKDKILPIESIVKLRSAAKSAEVLRTILITTGIIFVGAFGFGMAFAPISGGYLSGLTNAIGVLNIFAGSPLIIVPASVNNHKLGKWKYEIVN